MDKKSRAREVNDDPLIYYHHNKNNGQLMSAHLAGFDNYNVNQNYKCWFGYCPVYGSLLYCNYMNIAKNS